MKLSVEGATLEVECAGPAEAPPVLLWHGAACTLRQWDLVVDDLRDRFRLIRFDVRGAGQSSPAADPAQYSFEQYGRDALAILDHFGVERTHVWSMAWGSRAALAFCSLHPERVLSAAFFDASVDAADPKAQREGGKRARSLQDAAGIQRFPMPEGWNTHANGQDVVNASLGAARSFDLPAAVARLGMPVLVATGDHDPNLASSRRIVAAAPDACLVVMENVGHGSVLQRPDLAAATFTNFHAGLALN